MIICTVLTLGLQKQIVNAIKRGFPAQMTDFNSESEGIYTGRSLAND